jgi:hypothetical protein
MWLLIARIGAFIPGLFGKELGMKAAKAVGVVVVIVAAILLFLLAKAMYDRSVIADHEAEREAKAAPARERAADQRAIDTVRNAKSEEELHDVINNAPPGGTVSPAARALACERLRRIGRVPAACGPTGGDGAQARPD